MEQKKNLEESGPPAPTEAPVTHGGEEEVDKTIPTNTPPVPMDQTGGDDGEFISEDMLRKMDHVQLGEIYVKAGVGLPEGYDSKEIDYLVDYLIAEAG